jgi:hypothetical protein
LGCAFLAYFFFTQKEVSRQAGRNNKDSKKKFDGLVQVRRKTTLVMSIKWGKVAIGARSWAVFGVEESGCCDQKM